MANKTTEYKLSDLVNGDFEMYFCERNKINYWVLGYFGGGSINVEHAYKIATIFAKENNVPLETVQIDNIFKSNRYRGFKFLFSSSKNQLPHIKSYQVFSFHEFVK